MLHNENLPTFSDYIYNQGYEFNIPENFLIYALKITFKYALKTLRIFKNMRSFFENKQIKALKM